MRKKGKTWAVVLLAVCLLAAGGYFAYRATVKDYVDCCRMLMRVYHAEASDLSFSLSVDTAGTSFDTQFNAVRFPFQDAGAVQVTVRGKSRDYTFYNINGQAVTGETEPTLTAGESAVPKNFMRLLQWGAEVYESGLDIRKTKDRSRITYQVQVPDELVQAFMDSYVGSIEHMDFQYSDCQLTVVGSNGVLTEIALRGTATYRVLFVNASSNISVRARVNALGDQVKIPDVPASVVKSTTIGESK